VSGTIVERNPLIDDRPELVNEQPYGDGWLVIIEATEPAAVGALLDAAAYRGLVEQGA
jgi:glycine cleavage system H protein